MNINHAFLDMFRHVSFKERIRKILKGIKEPKDSGEYKKAKVEMQRLLYGNGSAILLLTTILVLLALVNFTPDNSRYITVRVIDPSPPPPLEKIEEVKLPDMDFKDIDMDIDAPVVQNEEIATENVPFSPQITTIESVALTKSRIIFPGIFATRNPGNIGDAVGKWNPKLNTETSVLRALRWLKTKQLDDGSWPNTKPAMTALSLLAYLAHGETPSSEEFGYTVQKGIEFLIANQENNGRFKGRDGHDYCQPICAYALCEAYAMTKIPAIKDAAEKAIMVVIKGQNTFGGFNYNLVGSSDTRNDTTYTSWCVQALKAAKIGGLYNDELDKCMAKAISGIKRNYGESNGYGGFGYTDKGNDKSCLTGAGLLCLQFLGDTKCKEYNGAIISLNNVTFSWETPFGTSPLYYWYYITQVSFQHGGDLWNSWNKMFSPCLVKNQNVIPKDQSGYIDHKGISHSIGYWVSPSKAEYTGGNSPVMDTVLCTLMLEVYYRYLPTFKIIEQDTIPSNSNSSDLNVSISLRNN